MAHTTTAPDCGLDCGSQIQHQERLAEALKQLEARRIRVRLVGENGNAYAIIGRCRQAARRAGASPAEILAFTEAVTSTGSYQALLTMVTGIFVEATMAGDGDDADA